MSWHEKYLSKNNKKATISSMGDLFNLIEEVFEVEKGNLFSAPRSSTQLLREQFLNEKKDMVLTLQAIPEIAVSELGWTDVSGQAGSEIEGPERKRLSQFLENIEGGNFVEKVASLQRFYQDPDAAMSMMFPEGEASSTAEQIKVALSYMVFFKTLTKVISNFNAASAGFNFEAFLAVLAGGFQVPANKGTIADFVSRTEGKDVPISLKLYGEGHLHVGGSFTDLVNDLVSPQYDVPMMRYIACTKKFEDDKKSGLDINGKIKFMRFDFTLQNVLNCMAISSKKSKNNALLAAEFIRRVESGEEDIDFRASLPGINLPSTQELEDEFIEEMHAILGERFPKEQIEFFIELIGWSKNDAPFIAIDVVDYDETGTKFVTPTVVRGQSAIPSSNRGKAENVEKYQSLLAMVSKNMPEDLRPDEDAPSSVIKQFNKDVTLVAKSFGAANARILARYNISELNKERDVQLDNAFDGVTLERSLEVYNKLANDPEKQKVALQNSFGYLKRKQFNLVQSAVEGLNKLVDPNTPVLPEGQDSVVFGTIEVGARNTQNMLNRMTSVLNNAIFDIFLSVKSIQDNTYAYVAGGMQEDAHANEAITASSNVISKTMELKSSTSTREVNESTISEQKMSLSSWDRSNAWRPGMFADKPRKESKKVVSALRQLTRDIFISPEGQNGVSFEEKNIPKNLSQMTNVTTVAAKYKPEDKEKVKEIISKLSLSQPAKKYTYYFGKTMSQQIEFPMTARENTALVMIWIYKNKNQEINITTQGDSVQ